MVPLSDGWSFCALVWMRSAGFPLDLIDRLGLGPAMDVVDRALDLEDAGAPTPERAAAMDEAESAVHEALTRARIALRDVLTGDRVREALFLMNPRFLETIEGHLARELRPRNSRSRQKETTAAKYLQRLATKNETASFFGPVAWGRFEPDADEGVSCSPAPGPLVSRRLVSFEHWAVQELARAVGRDPDVAAQLVPTLSPACRLDGRTLHYPVDQRTEASDRWVAVLERCDGSRTWAELLEELEADPAFSLAGPSPENVAEELLARRVVTRDILIPTVIHRPEGALLARVGDLDEPARSRWEPRIRWFYESAGAIGDAGLADRRRLMDDVEARFAELTGRAPSRRLGQMYAGRGLVYEDCERNAEPPRLGRRFIRRLEPLTALLEIARWITAELARRYETRFREIFLRLGGEAPVDFVRFVRETAWIGEEAAPDAELRREIAGAWQNVLGDRLGDPAPLLVITPEDCTKVLALLAGPESHAGREVLGARFHSLDLLVAASSHEAATGGGTIVLGELHKAVFLAAQPAAMPFCPDPEALSREILAAVEPPVVALTDAPSAYQRSDMNWPDLPGFHEILTEGAASRYPDDRTIPVARLEVVEDDGELFVRARDGGPLTWLFSVLTGFLQHRLLGIDPVELPPATAAPRVVLGDVVVRRRSWVLEAGRLRACRAQPDSAERLAWVRRIQRELGMPDRVFVKSPAEPKPIFVDFTSFFLVEILYKLAQEAPALSVTEMLPGPGELWLEDPAGATYTSELRATVCLDR